MSVDDQHELDRLLQLGQVVSLKDWIQAKLDAQKEALQTAKDEMDRRLDGMNHLKKQMEDQANTFVTKDGLQAAMLRTYIGWALAIAAIVVAWLK